jgi:two-component system cell cycle sensor histidine kinase/response regulator CckA
VNGIETAARPHTGEETILVVEDDDGPRRLATTVLRLNGYQVIGVAGGDEAIEAAAAHRGSIQLVLSDVAMPRMSGLQLARRLRELGLTVPTIFMTGCGDEDLADHGVICTPDTLLGKPFMPDALLERVRTTLDRRTRPT